MTQQDRDRYFEEKNLIFKDLCGRIPYHVHVQLNDNIYSYPFCENHAKHFWGYTIVKPYLFPLSSMTDELWDKEFMGCGITEFTRDSFKYGCETLEFNNSNPSLSSMVRFTNLLIKNHFDIHGLIPMGLAIDASKLNIY